MNEFQTAVLPLAAGMLLLFIAVWMSVVCGEVKTMMNRVFDIANGLFYAAIMAFQIARSIQAKRGDVQAPTETTTSSTTASTTTANSITTPQA